ncbi:MAG: 50S ribosomal protein P1, partial [Desulfurococcales archaeon]|nr:50S ribosomal protein P1 [Desulfurococcales archaeon]
MAQEGKAYIHAALALYYAGQELNEENLKKVVEALGIQPDEAKIKMLVASLTEINLEEVLKNAVAAPVAAVAAAPAAAPAAGGEEEKKEEEKKEEEEKEPEVDISEGLGGLFG